MHISVAGVLQIISPPASQKHLIGCRCPFNAARVASVVPEFSELCTAGVDQATSWPLLSANCAGCRQTCREFQMSYFHTRDDSPVACTTPSTVWGRFSRKSTTRAGAPRITPAGGKPSIPIAIGYMILACLAHLLSAPRWASCMV